jgi:hypothetical protein
MKTLDKTKNILNNLLLLWGTRQIGNTTLAREGTKNYDREFGLISHTKGFAQDILSVSSGKGKPYSIDHLEAIIGEKMPIIVDHAAMVNVLKDVLHHLNNSMPIDQVHQEIERESTRKVNLVTDKYVSVIDKLTRLTEIYQERSHKVERLFLDLTILHWWQFKEKKKLRKQIIDIIMESNSNELIPELFQGLEDLMKK